MNGTPVWLSSYQPPKIHLLFIGENYPKNPQDPKSTFFYRTLNPMNTSKGNYNLLNNLCKTFNITGQTENDKLLKFIGENYWHIDAFPHGSPCTKDLIQTTIANAAWLDDIIDFLVKLKPTQTVFTTLRSNGQLLPALERRAIQRRITLSSYTKIIKPLNGKQVFKDPSNRWWGMNKGIPGFDAEIKAVIAAGRLTP